MHCCLCIHIAVGSFLFWFQFFSLVYLSSSRSQLISGRRVIRSSSKNWKNLDSQCCYVILSKNKTKKNTHPTNEHKLFPS